MQSTFATGFSAGTFGIDVDTSGNVFVSDTYNNVIKKITSGGAVSTFATGFNNPQCVCTDSYDNVYVTDFGNNYIKRVRFGVVTTIATFTFPQWITCDKITNNLYVQGDPSNNPTIISKIT